MNSTGNKLVVIEADAALRAVVTEILTEAGYEVSAADDGDLKSVLAFEPEVVILGAEPLRPDCCDLLSEIKGSVKTNHIRVIMLTPGDPAKRRRGLDLGADDVLSVPFDEHELLARVRAQLRQKHPEDELRQKIDASEERKEAAREVIQAVNQQRKVLRAGILAVLVIAVLATAGLYKAISQLQSEFSTEKTGKLVNNKEAATDRSASQTPEAGSKGEESVAGAAKATPDNLPDLNGRLLDADRRLQRLEAESRIAEDIIRLYSPSVCLIHVVVGFKEPSSGLPLRYLESPSPPTNPGGRAPLGGFTGNGPEVRIDGFATGFLISANGGILTNHHVINPWRHDPNMDEIVKGGPEPVVTSMTAYFPGVPRGIALRAKKTSPGADLALVMGNVQGLSLKPLVLEDGPKAAVSGQPVVLLGYPTALDAILARADRGTVRAIVASVSSHPERLVAEVARRGLIRPVNTQGHIGDVLPDRIIYDAQTAFGGSGGPLFNAQGKVIGVNFAVLADFGGSNLAIPARYARAMLTDESGGRAQHAHSSNFPGR
jgi:serine protease Do